MTFRFGTDGATELTEDQVLDQLQHVHRGRCASPTDFGCDAIGIQYQQGLKDMAPASDLAEGLLNDADRPPVRAVDGARVLYRGPAGARTSTRSTRARAVDALVTNRVWTALGLDPATTLHDVRWGAPYGDDYVWVFEISGAVPPAHLVGGYAGAVSERQPPVYFGLGGGTIKGVSRPGEIVWSRVFLMDGRAPRGPRAGDGRRAARGGDRAALAGDHAAVADHARGPPRRHPRPDDGPAPRQPHPGRIRRPTPRRRTPRSRPRRRCSTRWASRSTSAGTCTVG